jgi:N-acetylneuraminic acid mutarotase
LALPRSEYAAAVLGGLIYVAGGFGAEQSFDRYDPEIDQWERLADLPEPRHHLTLLAVGEHLYIGGGLNAEANEAQPTFWRYDPSSNAWEKLAPLPQGARGSLGGGAIDGALYFVGGSAGNLSGPATADLARYDPVAARWDLLEPMPTAREHVGANVAAGLLIAVGGRNGGHESHDMLSATEIYDPVPGVWRGGAALPTPRAGVGVASDGERIVVVGGERIDGGSPVTLGAVEAYDPVLDTWIALALLPVARHGVAAAITDGGLYAIGGSIAGGRVQNIRSVDRIDL